MSFQRKVAVIEQELFLTFATYGCNSVEKYYAENQFMRV